MMATKMFCDRCGAESTLSSRVTDASVRRMEYYGVKPLFPSLTIADDDYELCASCAYKLKLWLNEKKTNFGVI